MITLHSARKFEELLTGEVESSPYEYATLFKAEGFWQRRQAAKRLRLLQTLDGKLRRILRPSERVYFLTSGTTISLSEQFFVGWAAAYLNMRALVFTTERVLLVQLSGNRKKARELVAQIPYPALASVKSTWTGCCRIKLTDGNVLKFSSMPARDRKFIAEFLAGIVRGSTAPFGAGRSHGIENLCPHCYVHVPAHPPACPACGGGFKSPQQAALRSFLFPGLGDWYLGHRGFAILELLGSGFMWLVLVVAPLLAPEDPELGPPTAEYWLTAAVIIFIAHAIDAMMTRHFARKGHHPAGQVSAGPLPPLVTAGR